ncbi:hypothetical protein C7S20_15740 [Christiangramia fulva]|uniref:Uncharacterized protein n=1 Tax=Christiangramia fulva TaxID=2126553 RepID=A0A2R3Z8J1_9FLAO|nr:hypothetical protein [Christiangramia fulva]AVR46596.1 hypothetical protein C7S20_15740 [Christiangramia fulva]
MINTKTGNKNIDTFLECYNKNLKSGSPRYDGSRLILNIKSDFQEAISNIENVFYEVNTLVAGSIEIKLSSCKITNVSFFFGTNDFSQKYDRIKKNFILQNIIILNSSGHHILKKEYDTYDEGNAVIYNIHEYHQILDYFLRTPEFTPYKSDTDNQFTLISKTHGVFNVGYNLPDVTFFQNVNLNGLFSRFQEQFEKKEFIQFFKEIVIAGVHNTPEEKRYNEIIREHNSLLNLAKRDYETYVSNFAFDKIKSEFKEERGKYFETIDRNIDSIGKQVISFPLTFGATVFASYKVKDQPEFLILILAAYLLYTIIAFLILRMTAYNVKCLCKDVNDEELTIQKSYGVIYEGFKSDFKKIKHKILNLRFIIGVLYFVLIMLLLLFTIFTFYYIDIDYLSYLIE